MADDQIYPYSDVPSVMDESTLRLRDMVPFEGSATELEIGFGKGRFLLGRAEKNPEVAFVGLETRRKWVHLATERARKRNISNTRVWLGDAKAALPKITDEASVRRVFINFPDPWWKERHAKRMVVGADLVLEVARLLEDSGELFVQTDVDFRANHYLEVLSNCGLLAPSTGDGTLESNPYGTRTLREVRCEEVGLPVYRMLFVRKPRV